MTQTRVGVGRSGTAGAHAGTAALTELKLPANREYIVVAKRAAGALGLVSGFSLEEIDDLNIAVAQACENAIAAAAAQWGPDTGQLKLLFKVEQRRLEVEIRSIPPRDVEVHLMPAVRRSRSSVEYDYEGIALNMIRLFVDELRYHIDNQTGSMRMRMVKYLIE